MEEYNITGFTVSGVGKSSKECGSDMIETYFVKVQRVIIRIAGL